MWFCWKLGQKPMDWYILFTIPNIQGKKYKYKCLLKNLKLSDGQTHGRTKKWLSHYNKNWDFKQNSLKIPRKYIISYRLIPDRPFVCPCIFVSKVAVFVRFRWNFICYPRTNPVENSHNWSKFRHSFHSYHYV